MDLTIPYPQPVDNDIVADLLGGTPDEVPEAYADASPISWVDVESSPFLIVHGTLDTVNPVEHSRSMTSALHDAGVEVAYFEDPLADHFTWGDWNRLDDWVLAQLAFNLGDPI